MARRRLNKKVALVGSAVFVLLIFLAIVAILYLARDPQKFISDGDEALEAARLEVVQEEKEQQYEKAQRNYLRARARAKEDELKVQILFKLADVFYETDQWNKVIGAWNEIIRVQSNNAKARYGRLKYMYIMADSLADLGLYGGWQDVRSDASDFLKVAEQQDLLSRDVNEFESYPMGQAEKLAQTLEPYLYLVRGRAVLGMATMGAVTDTDESLANAISDLEKVRQLEPNNIDACWYLAQTFKTKGQILASKGNVEEAQKGAAHAIELLELAAEAADDDVRAQVNMLKMKRDVIISQMPGAGSDKQQLNTLEPEYLLLVEKFNSSAEAYAALAEFYLMLGHDYLDKAVEEIDRATELDRQAVPYAITAAELHYRRFSLYKRRPDLHRGLEIAENALDLADAQQQSGPRYLAARTYRTSLYVFLAKCYTEQAMLLQGETDSDQVVQYQEWLKRAGQVVHQIEQLRGSGEDPVVVKWRGMLELAKGNRTNAIRILYTVYEQIKGAAEKPHQLDPHLCFTLAEVFKGTSEDGAILEFLAGALNAGIYRTKPEVFLDYAEMLLKVRMYEQAISVINSFEQRYWKNDRSNRIRIEAYAGAGQVDEIEQELAKRDTNDPNTLRFKLVIVQAKIKQVQRTIGRQQMKESTEQFSGGDKETAEPGSSTQLMQAELVGCIDDMAKLLSRLLETEPNAVPKIPVNTVIRSYIAQGKITEAKNLAGQCLRHFPDNTRLKIYQKVLSEPEPNNVPEERFRQINQGVLEDIEQPQARAMSLGIFYQGYNEPNKAVAEFRKILETKADGRKVFETAGTDVNLPSAMKAVRLNNRRLAAGYLFDIALIQKDWPLADEVLNLARGENLDDCEGTFFAARLDMARQRYEAALANLNESLKYRPVFSYAYMLRSSVNGALGNEHAFIEDARKASSLNPLDAAIAKHLASALFRRNQKLGDDTSSDQVIEARTAIDRARILNPGDLELYSFYAEYISSTEPARALAIRQGLQKANPTVENALLLGKMAVRIASQNSDSQRKKALFDMALSSFEQAKAIEPDNRDVISSLAEYYRLTGQPERAEELLQQSQDKQLQWIYYYQDSRFDKAREILNTLYQDNPSDVNILKGLWMVSEKSSDREGIRKYSEELLALEENVQNELLQIQSFLKVGLVQEVEGKLESFRERYPESSEALLLEAALVMRKGQMNRALELVNQNLESNRNNFRAWRLRGQVNLFKGDPEQAIIDLKRSKLLTDEPSTRIILARAYLRAGRYEDAVMELKSAIDMPAVDMEARALLEQVYWRLGKKEELEKFYKETLDKFADSDYWYNQAGAFAMAQNDFEKAEQLYGQAIELAEQHGNVRVEVVDGYMLSLIKGGKIDKVFEFAGRYVDRRFAPVVYLRMAEAKFQLNDKNAAVEFCRKAVDKAGTNEQLTSMVLQRMYNLLGAEELHELCQEKLTANPDSIAANLAMFNLANINGQYNKALDYIEKMLEIAGPNSPGRVSYMAKKAEVLQAAYRKTSDNVYLKRSVDVYESLLAEMPNNTSVLNNLAYLLAEKDIRLDDAVEYARRAYQVEPENPSYLDTYSYVLYKKGEYAQAAEFLQAALQQYEQGRISAPWEVYEHLGQVHEKLGSLKEALAAFRQALDVGDQEQAQQAKERINAAIERISSQSQD
ncbi:MAG: tetratricopeptide repeat protein [Sedimentisphaerales bacterium]|nr:tetratricopeptide repeat protein [Sedimentisphaerales bacterium]